MTRLLDLAGAELAALRGGELTDAVRASEGRVLLSEVVAGSSPLLSGCSNPELVCAQGADLICLNLFDPTSKGPAVRGLEHLEPEPEGIGGLARLLGRPVGLNLEPDVATVPEAFRATDATLRAARESGAAFVVITANPGRGTTVDDIAAATSTARRVGGLCCFAGKMHQAGATESLGPEMVEHLVQAGAHGVLVPLPGTVPGISEADAGAMVNAAHDGGAVAMGTIGTSQEGAHEGTIRELALTAKRVGVDLHHIGDAGLNGIARPENIYAYSVAIRGVRHTWSRMGRNVRASWGYKDPG
jgi:hypothetical protein